MATSVVRPKREVRPPPEGVPVHDLFGEFPVLCQARDFGIHPDVAINLLPKRSDFLRSRDFDVVVMSTQAEVGRPGLPQVVG